MLLRKFFENVHAAMAVLVLFVKFSRKFCSNFLTLILSASPNMIYFVRTFSRAGLFVQGTFSRAILFAHFA